MESQPQNPEFRINPETFHPCSTVQSLFNTPHYNRSGHNTFMLLPIFFWPCNFKKKL